MKTGTPLTKEDFEQAMRGIDGRFTAIDVRFDSLERSVDAKIESLATATAKGFAEVDDNFKEIRLDLYETENRLGGKIDKLDQRIGEIEKHIGRIDMRYSNLNELVLIDHAPRIRKLEQEIRV